MIPRWFMEWREQRRRYREARQAVAQCSAAARLLSQRAHNMERNRIIDTANEIARAHGKPLLPRRPV